VQEISAKPLCILVFTAARRRGSDTMCKIFPVSEHPSSHVPHPLLFRRSAPTAEIPRKCANPKTVYRQSTSETGVPHTTSATSPSSVAPRATTSGPHNVQHFSASAPPVRSLALRTPYASRACTPCNIFRDHTTRLLHTCATFLAFPTHGQRSTTLRSACPTPSSLRFARLHPVQHFSRLPPPFPHPPSLHLPATTGYHASSQASLRDRRKIA
jgi:hypothetical protein